MESQTSKKRQLELQEEVQDVTAEEYEGSSREPATSR